MKISKRSALIAALAVCGLCGWSFAQNGNSAARRGRDEDGMVGKFAVSGGAQASVLIDTTTGMTWVLARGTDGGAAVWLPVERVETVEELPAWQDRQREAAKAAAEREYEERRAERTGKKGSK